MPIQHLRREATRLGSEQQRVATGKWNFGVRRFGVSAQAKNAATGDRLEIGETGVTMELDGVPVVEAGAAEGALINAEAERANQVQGAIRGGAQAGDVAGVGRDFRFVKRDVQHGGSRLVFA